MILYPAIDILDGQAVRLVEGRFEDDTIYHDDPLDGRAARGSTRARASCTSSTSTAPAPASRARSSTCAGSSQETGVPVQYGGGLRTVAGGARGAARRRRARDRRHRRVPRRRLPRRRSSPPSAPRVVVSVDVRGGHISTAGWTQTTADAGRRRDPPPRATAACASFVYTTSTATAGSRARTSTRSAQVAEAVRGRFLYSGGIGALEDLQRARRAAPGQPRRRDRRQGALREALHGRRGPGRARLRPPRRRLQPRPHRPPPALMGLRRWALDR